MAQSKKQIEKPVQSSSGSSCTRRLLEIFIILLIIVGTSMFFYLKFQKQIKWFFVTRITEKQIEKSYHHYGRHLIVNPLRGVKHVTLKSHNYVLRQIDQFVHNRQQLHQNSPTKVMKNFLFFEGRSGIGKSTALIHSANLYKQKKGWYVYYYDFDKILKRHKAKESLKAINQMTLSSTHQIITNKFTAKANTAKNMKKFIKSIEALLEADKNVILMLDSLHKISGKKQLLKLLDSFQQLFKKGVYLIGSSQDTRPLEYISKKRDFFNKKYWQVTTLPLPSQIQLRRYTKANYPKLLQNQVVDLVEQSNNFYDIIYLAKNRKKIPIIKQLAERVIQKAIRNKNNFKLLCEICQKGSINSNENIKPLQEKNIIQNHRYWFNRINFLTFEENFAGDCKWKQKQEKVCVDSRDIQQRHNIPTILIFKEQQQEQIINITLANKQQNNKQQITINNSKDSKKQSKEKKETKESKDKKRQKNNKEDNKLPKDIKDKQQSKEKNEQKQNKNKKGYKQDKNKKGQKDNKDNKLSKDIKDKKQSKNNKDNKNTKELKDNKEKKEIKNMKDKDNQIDNQNQKNKKKQKDHNDKQQQNNTNKKDNKDLNKKQQKIEKEKKLKEKNNKKQIKQMKKDKQSTKKAWKQKSTNSKQEKIQPHIPHIDNQQKSIDEVNNVQQINNQLEVNQQEQLQAQINKYIQQLQQLEQNNDIQNDEQVKISDQINNQEPQQLIINEQELVSQENNNEQNAQINHHHDQEPQPKNNEQKSIIEQQQKSTKRQKGSKSANKKSQGSKRHNKSVKSEKSINNDEHLNIQRPVEQENIAKSTKQTQPIQQAETQHHYYQSPQNYDINIKQHLDNNHQQGVPQDQAPIEEPTVNQPVNDNLQGDDQFNRAQTIPITYDNVERKQILEIVQVI